MSFAFVVLFPTVFGKSFRQAFFVISIYSLITDEEFLSSWKTFVELFLLSLCRLGYYIHYNHLIFLIWWKNYQKFIPSEWKAELKDKMGPPVNWPAFNYY